MKLIVNNILLCLIYQVMALLIILHFKVGGGRLWELSEGRELRRCEEADKIQLEVQGQSWNPHAFTYSVKVLVTHLCPVLWDGMDCNWQDSSVHGILQARTLAWVAISFSNAWKWKVKVKLLNRVRLLVTPWTAAHQAPPSTGFSRQEYWSGVPLPSLSFAMATNNSSFSACASVDNKWLHFLLLAC